VVYVNRYGTTKLTEVQAKALADWWGGRYQQLIKPEGSGEIWHGVVFGPSEVAVLSLEDAQALENVRDAVNPSAPDWVG
jgi:hypothetical protein